MTSGIISGPTLKSDLFDQSLSALFIDRLKRHGKHTALIDDATGEEVTFDVLLEKSTKLADGLKRIGFKRNDVVAFLMENHLNYYVAYFACMYIGVIIHKLNPDFKPYELKHLLNISKPTAIFTTKLSTDAALWIKDEFEWITKIICIETCSGDHLDIETLIKSSTIDAYKFVPEIFDTNQQTLSIYNSSGTTGLPKGVMLTHDNILVSILKELLYKSLDFQENQHLLVYMPFFHIYGGSMVLFSLFFKMKCVISNKFDRMKFLKQIEQYKPPTLFLVPHLAIFLAKDPSVLQYDLSSLETVFCGAASLGEEIQKQFVERFQINIQQLYGLTETTGSITIFPKTTTHKSHPGCIGVLFPGVSAKICDLITNAPVGPNKTGEICFRGVQITKGYFNNAKATADAIDADGFLHTGDVGYYDEDGYFYMIDRFKELIKFKSYQISPTEMEDLIISHESIVDACVVGKFDENVGEKAVAFVVKSPNVAISEQEIIDFVADKLMYPKHLHGGVKFVDAIPRTASGKTMRKKLSEIINL